MTANRAFALLVWLGMGGVALLLAAGVRLAFGSNTGSHDALDGVCVFVPVHGDFVSHALSYVAVALLIGLVSLALRYTSLQVLASRTREAEMAGPAPGRGDERLQRIISGVNITHRVWLVPSEAKLAFTAGLWRPSIFVSRALVLTLSDRQLEAVLLHEEHHAQRRDPLRLMAGQALSAILCFLPVLRNLHDYYCIAKEVAADAVAVQKQGTRTHLASALCKVSGPSQTEYEPRGFLT